MSRALQALVAFPATPSRQLGEVLRESTNRLVELSITGQGLKAIEAHRREVLSFRIPRTAVTIRLRVWFSVLVDLACQGWVISVESQGVTIRMAEAVESDPMAEKARVRNGHLIERDRHLREESVKRFIREMESSRIHRGQWTSVFSLMRDGESLARDLERAITTDTPDPYRAAISPYLQIADSNATCEFTGLRLVDVWRYFRLTWSTVPQTVPGRRMMILIRDRAAENHPIIGVAALGSPVVQLSVRDSWIGWTPAQFTQQLQQVPSVQQAKWALRGIEDAIDDVYRRDLVRDGLITAKEILQPSIDAIARLRHEAHRARRAHVRYAKSGRHKHATSKPGSVDWSVQSKTYLFRSKRCLALAAALEARSVLNELGLRTPSKAALKAVVADANGRRALASVLRYMKAKHVGIDMAEITVCGAVAPYSQVLGGKLVSLLVTSPEVVSAYRTRYLMAPSLIASAVKGQFVTRRPNLVLLGTTSLYGVASSQYNRLVIPKGSIPNLRAEIRYYKLGKTSGFGSYHFSKTTTEEMALLAQQQRSGRRVNNIFGEGVSPKLRRLREALSTLGFPSDLLLQHGSPRLVYGVPLASNFHEILLGKAKRPKYILRPRRDSEGTEAISRYWRERWLARRVQASETISAIRQHSTLRPIRHGARVFVPDDGAELPLFSRELKPDSA